MHDVLSTIYDGNGFDIKQNIAFEYKVKINMNLVIKTLLSFLKIVQMKNILFLI